MERKGHKSSKFLSPCISQNLSSYSYVAWHLFDCSQKTNCQNISNKNYDVHFLAITWSVKIWSNRIYTWTETLRTTGLATKGLILCCHPPTICLHLPLKNTKKLFVWKQKEILQRQSDLINLKIKDFIAKVKSDSTKSNSWQGP